MLYRIRRINDHTQSNSCRDTLVDGELYDVDPRDIVKRRDWGMCVMLDFRNKDSFSMDMDRPSCGRIAMENLVSLVQEESEKVWNDL